MFDFVLSFYLVILWPFAHFCVFWLQPFAVKDPGKGPQRVSPYRDAVSIRLERLEAECLRLREANALLEMENSIRKPKADHGHPISGVVINGLLLISLFAGLLVLAMLVVQAVTPFPTAPIPQDRPLAYPPALPYGLLFSAPGDQPILSSDYVPEPWPRIRRRWTCVGY